MSTEAAPERWQRLEELFFEASDLEPSARPAFLAQACGSDTELRREVEALLRSSDRTLADLRRPIDEAAREVVQHKSGQRIGPYQIVKLLGEGGMGLVYLANRADQQFQQQVAIKLMHAGFGQSPEMLRRFRAERQILANLDHPNIARLLDGGITPEGAPYLVMEYVDGVVIDEYCQRNPLPAAELLQLFRTVCGAVEYAHRNLVVHRDIKPGNILVTAEGVPKLLDFGIAKLMDPEAQGPFRTVATQRLMTPEYASPEQVRGEPVTTATDVYALGVLLYELATGRSPFRIETKSPLEIARAICEQEPIRPSTASRTSASLAPLEARELRGDLDHIVLKAMRKEPEQRYASVAAFSEDLLRYLRGYPVQAASGARRYQARKFIGRHRAAAIAASVAALALIAFGVEMGLLARRATLERLRAEREAQFLASIFQAATPSQARGQEVTARELLDQGAKRVDQELAGDPELQATMLLNIGQAYDSLGLYTQAHPLMERAYQIRKRAPGRRGLDLAAAAQGLGTTLRLEDQYAKAEPLFREALAIRQRAPGNNNELVADSLIALGECLYLENKDQEAEALLRKALTIPLSADSTLRAASRDYLALELFRQGAYREATQLLEEAVDVTRRLQGEDSPDYANYLHNLAGAFLREGDLLDAIAMDRRDLALRRKVLGADHPDLTYTLNNLGWALVESGNWNEAEPFLAEHLVIARKHFDPKSPRLIGPLDNWARLLQAKGDYAGAAQCYQQALEILQQTSGPVNWSVAQVLANIGVLQFDRGDYPAAERYARQALEMRRKLGGDQHPDVAASLIDLAIARWFQNDPAAAEPLARQALQIREKKLEPGHPDILIAQVRLGEILTAEGKAAEAEPVLRKALDAADHPPFPLVPWQTAEAQNALGMCLVSLHRYSEAEALLRESEAPLETDPRPAFRHQANASLVTLRTAMHQN
ncbi:MAG TPA: serine/threonine-protein kinase [Terriglobia bacterium]|nr:serine/threonine-protein kinase [Terriglobia bacterium]